MKPNYLKDSAFLAEFDRNRIKTQYVRITLLDWEENPIQEIQGKVAAGGNLNIDGSSSVRRTANLKFLLEGDETAITNPRNLLSINKKIKIAIGFENNTKKYQKEKYIWFPLGTFVISQASISRSGGDFSVSLQLKDKMCLLNGDCGGTLIASVCFNDILDTDENGAEVHHYPLIEQIIREAVNHFGGEQLSKIIISDIDSKIRKIMKWNGTEAVYILKATKTSERKLSYTDSEAGYEKEFGPIKPGMDIGYIYSDFICPSGVDLTLNAGDSVCTLLDKIKNLLGNYEYFYDLDGNFIFREVKNYLNTSYSTSIINQLNENKDGSEYLVDLTSGKIAYNFNDSILISSYSNSPQYNMIKNDFIVWGLKEMPSGTKVPIRYHLAIDKKPEVGNKYTVVVFKDEVDKTITRMKRAVKLATVDELPQPGAQGYYFIIPIEGKNKIFTWDAEKLDYKTVKGKIQSVTTSDWRTELFMQGINAEPYGLESNYYYTELQNEWERIYDISEGCFKEEVLDDPTLCQFYLDFIDTDSNLDEFNVNNIGRRTKVLVDDNINCLFAPEIPNYIFIKNGDEEARRDASERGEVFIQVTEDEYEAIVPGGRNSYSAYDAIRDLLYQYTSYNESVSIQAIPIYYLEPNVRISLTDSKSDIYGDYVIKSISLPLDPGGSMSISAVRALERI